VVAFQPSPHSSQLSTQSSAAFAQTGGVKEKVEPPVARRTEPVPETPRQVAHGLIALQTFQGSFPLTLALAAILGVRLQDLEAKLMQFIPVAGSTLIEERQLWATVLAVKMFEGRLKGEKEMWELVVEKAREWMAGLGTDGNVKRLEALAGEVVGA